MIVATAILAQAPELAVPMWQAALAFGFLAAWFAFSVLLILGLTKRKP